MIVYEEPGEKGEVVRVTLTPERAVDIMRGSAMKAKDYTYASDADALDDFMVVHWAWEEVVDP